jgi:predicted Ser/Thr protein kinase
MNIILILIILVILLFSIIKYISNKSNYSKGDIIYKSDKTEIYNLKNNNKYLLKKFLKNKNTIPEQVKINNESNVSPKIIEYGLDYYIIEKLDYTLKDMVLNREIDKNTFKKFIEINRKIDKYKYSHNDLHWDNYLWDLNNKEFKIIDWEKANINKSNINKSNINDRDYLILKIKETTLGLHEMVIEQVIKYSLSKYDNEKIENEEEILLLFSQF